MIVCSTWGGEALAFAAGVNTPGKSDATGAFLPEGRAFKKHTVGRLFQVDTAARDQSRRKSVYRNLTAVENPLSYLAFFCHGWRTGIQFGFRLHHLTYLARHLSEISHPDLTVALFCCSTAQGGTGGDGGFADDLRDQLCMYGLVDCKVIAHTTKGHTTSNPYVRIFEGDGSRIGGIGGRYVVEPKSELWPAWKKELRDSEKFRIGFPLMSREEIAAHLRGEHAEE